MTTPQVRGMLSKQARVTARCCCFIFTLRRAIFQLREMPASMPPRLRWSRSLMMMRLRSPEWLGALVRTLKTSNADVVLGPVQAVYRPDCSGWMRDGDFHSTKPVWVAGEIITGYTCNVLFRRAAPALNGRRFRLDLGAGGEDTIFFSAAHRAGGKIDYAANALVTEAVAVDRANLAWLLRRRFRVGQTHGLLLLEDGKSRMKNISVASAKAGICLAAACFNIIGPPERRLYWLLRGAMHGGVVCRLLWPNQHVVPAASSRSAAKVA